MWIIFWAICVGVGIVCGAGAIIYIKNFKLSFKFIIVMWVSLALMWICNLAMHINGIGK